MGAREAVLYLDRIDAVLFDIDGVVTDTAHLHVDAWKQTFDDFLARRGREIGVDLAPFDRSDDYLRFMQDRSRREGLRAFLASRGFKLAEQNGPSGADADTLWSLVERKDARYRDTLERDEVMAFRDAMELVRELRRRGIATAAASAGRDGLRTLTAAGVNKLFDVRMDGAVLNRLNRPGKPDPALFTAATHRLGAVPSRTVVFDDALSGAEAGRRGGFTMVVGVDRSGDLAGELYERGATVVVRSLTDVVISGHRRAPLISRP